MLLNNKISNVPEADPALDQQQLHAIGLDHVRRLSRNMWTDHNIHDPGITTLELLCYALTDLAYRAQFPIEDLLATPTGNAENMARQFFTPRQILPNRPLTANDYRKLLIDMKGVKNAWILPAKERRFADTINNELLFDDPRLGNPAQNGIREVNIRGLYNVLLELDETATDTPEKIKADAMSLLQKNRNLCEDFIGVELVEDQFYTLCAELELTPDADQNKVAACIQFEVERYLTPPVLNSSLADMLDRTHEDGSAYTVAEIFEGPPLMHGFIDDAELQEADLRTEIRLSDIIGIIMDIDGVRAVRDIIVNPLTPGNDPEDKPVAPANKWIIPAPSGKCPRLSDRQGRLVCYKRDIPISLDPKKFQDELKKLNDALKAKLDEVNEEDISIPLGRFRDTGRYQSFQHHFPLLYGLSDQGLPANSDDQRRALAMQLKGYLLFFDQVMANYLAQLGNVRELFARDTAVDSTYFAQVVETFPEAARIYADGTSIQDLTNMLESDAAALARRNRFLDHLLSRLAEDFHHYVSIMHSISNDDARNSIALKYAFLKDYPALGAERSLAYNYTLTAQDALWNSFNVSGLERRLARLLGIWNFSRRYLSTVPHDIYPEIDKTPGDEFRFRIRHVVAGKILLSSSTHYVTEEAAIAEMNQAIKMAQDRKNYQCNITHDGKHYFNIVDTGQEVVARRIEYFNTPEQMNAAIDTLINLMILYPLDNGEGMYLIENILLRPRDPNDPFMPICIDPNCTDCADGDPYSCRLHFVLPAYAGRFQNMDFRRFVEETIRAETPAHILPKVCWVSAGDMAEVESAYRDWISLVAGADTANRKNKLDALISALTQAKNVYPAQPLHDCGYDPNKPPFVLGRFALGSKSAT